MVYRANVSVFTVFGEGRARFVQARRSEISLPTVKHICFDNFYLKVGPLPPGCLLVPLFPPYPGCVADGLALGRPTSRCFCIFEVWKMRLKVCVIFRPWGALWGENGICGVRKSFKMESKMGAWRDSLREGRHFDF